MKGQEKAVAHTPVKKISVIVPENPFAQTQHGTSRHCLCALDVADLMRWWPGKPHVPKIYAAKVRAIQRSLDWKRVAQIASYLLQEEIHEVPDKLDECFRNIYEPKKNEPGREWPPRIGKSIGYEKSEYRVFSNILVHVNGAKLDEKKIGGKKGGGELKFNEDNPLLNFSVIDGQHRINGAYFALKILESNGRVARWELPAEVFLDLDPAGEPPRLQAQIFIDVNFYQKKVDRSLVADLFPTARGPRSSLDDKERAQDIGRKLMLETGPLVGMIQIPGIKYGYKDVITLATLNTAIEDVIGTLTSVGIESLEGQTEFLAQCLTSWLIASGRFEEPNPVGARELDSSNVAYQGRVLVSIITLIPAMIWKLRSKNVLLMSEKAKQILPEFLGSVATNAGLLDNGVFIDKKKFQKHKILGSGGIALFRDLLWASVRGRKTSRLKATTLTKFAEENRTLINKSLFGQSKTSEA